MVYVGSIGFFFGADALQPFGIPSMKKMTHDFTSILEKNGLSKETELYNEIVNILKKEMGEVDIEAILSVIDGLKVYSIESLD
jgi:hypothetical protein